MSPVPTPVTPGGFKAGLYRAQGLAYLRILKWQMLLGGLKIGSKTVELAPGVFVQCSVCFNHEVMQIFFKDAAGVVTIVETTTTTTTTNGTTTTTTSGGGTTTTTTSGTTTTTTSTEGTTTTNAPTLVWTKIYSTIVDDGVPDTGETGVGESIENETWKEYSTNPFSLGATIGVVVGAALNRGTISATIYGGPPNYLPSPNPLFTIVPGSDNVSYNGGDRYILKIWVIDEIVQAKDPANGIFIDTVRLHTDYWGWVAV